MYTTDDCLPLSASAAFMSVSARSRSWNVGDVMMMQMDMEHYILFSKFHFQCKPKIVPKYGLHIEILRVFEKSKNKKVQKG